MLAFPVRQGDPALAPQRENPVMPSDGPRDSTRNIPFTVLASTPRNLPPCWARAFEALKAPVLLGYGLFFNAEPETRTEEELRSKWQFLNPAFKRLEATLDDLDVVAPLTCKAGYAIRESLWHAWARLSSLETDDMLGQQITPQSLDSIRKRLRELMAGFDAYQLLFDLREAVAAEKSIRLPEAIATDEQQSPTQASATKAVIPPPNKQITGPFELKLDTNGHKALRNGGTAEFKGYRLAWDVFVELATRYDAWYSLGELGHAVWNRNGNDVDPENNAVAKTISTVRRLIRALGLTVEHTRGIGYRLAEFRAKEVNTPSKAHQNGRQKRPVKK